MSNKAMHVVIDDDENSKDVRSSRDKNWQVQPSRKKNANNNRKKNENEQNDNTPAQAAPQQKPPVKAGASYYNNNVHPLSTEYTFWFMKKERAFVGDTLEALQHSYEDQVKSIGDFSTVEGFWGFYSHLLRPNQMPMASEYHLFRKGVKPMWEDEYNAKGGKLSIRVKKEFTNRLWEDLLIAVIGNQFEVGDDEICGVVLSIREHDVLSIWHKTAENYDIRDKLKEKLKSLLKLPLKTYIEYRQHDTIKEKVQLQLQQQQLLQQQQAQQQQQDEEEDSGDI